MWQDVFGSLVNWFPLQVYKNQIPFILQPQQGGNASINPLVLQAAGTGTITFQIPSDCVIQIDQWNAWSTALSSTNPTSLGFLANIWYGNGDVQLTQNPTPAELIFGNAQRPGRWGYRPWVVTRPRETAFGQLTIQCTDTSGTTNSIYFALMGFRWKQGGPS